MNLPLLRTKPVHPGVWGVEGADNPLGVRTVPSITVYYVDYNYPTANDTHDGTDPEHPLKTIQAAVNKVSDYDWIVVRSINALGESVVTKDFVSGANYVKLIGSGVSKYAITWKPATQTYICLDLRAVGWEISGFTFDLYGHINGVGIEIRHTDTGANDIAIRTIIENCRFTSSGIQ
jgi:hypothetical protein